MRSTNNRLRFAIEDAKSRTRSKSLSVYQPRVIGSGLTYAKLVKTAKCVKGDFDKQSATKVG